MQVGCPYGVNSSKVCAPAAVDEMLPVFPGMHGSYSCSGQVLAHTTSYGWLPPCLLLGTCIAVQLPLKLLCEDPAWAMIETGEERDSQAQAAGRRATKLEQASRAFLPLPPRQLSDNLRTGVSIVHWHLNFKVVASIW